MIKDDFLIKTPEGIYCRYGSFYLDPQQPVKNAVISHAHGDHAKAGNVQVYCTSFTRQLMQLRYKMHSAKYFYTYNYHQKFEVNGVEITFYPAGHILGSAMINMNYKGINYLYTGDYKLQPDNTCEAAEFPYADVLITESTFAKPDVKHPDADTEIKKLNHVQSNILLGVYGLGKAQRITSLINQYCPDKNILVHYSIYPIHRLYAENGITLGEYELYNRKILKQNLKNQIYLVPPLTFNSYRGDRNIVRVFASGWKYLQQGNDLALYISDHADWNDILKTVTYVNPSELWTLHGDGTSLKAYYDQNLKVKIL